MAEESASDLAEALGGLPLFRDLDARLLSAIAACCTVNRLAARDELFREGQPCDAFFAVLKGAVRVYRVTQDGREQIVHHVAPGRTFAEAALLHHRRYPASAAADVTPTEVVRVDGRRFQALLVAEPRLGPSMIGSLCGWLHALVDRIELLSKVSAGARLAQYLLQLPARTEGEALVVELPVAKKTLAGELSITPETLSRLLARWKELGVVQSQGRRVVLADVRALEAMTGSTG
jgi:CRP-like cAMP-binding protein